MKHATLYDKLQPGIFHNPKAAPFESTIYCNIAILVIPLQADDCYLYYSLVLDAGGYRVSCGCKILMHRKKTITLYAALAVESHCLAP